MHDKPDCVHEHYRQAIVSKALQAIGDPPLSVCVQNPAGWARE